MVIHKEKTLSTYIDQNTVLSYVGKYHVTVHRVVPIDTPLLFNEFSSITISEKDGPEHILNVPITPMFAENVGGINLVGYAL